MSHQEKDSRTEGAEKKHISQLGDDDATKTTLIKGSDAYVLPRDEETPTEQQAKPSGSGG